MGNVLNPQYSQHSYFYTRQLKIKFDLATKGVAPFAALLTFPGFEEKLDAIDAQVEQTKRLVAILQETPARLLSLEVAPEIPDASEIAFAAIRFFFEHETALKALEEAGVEEAAATEAPEIKDVDTNTTEDKADAKDEQEEDYLERDKEEVAQVHLMLRADVLAIEADLRQVKCGPASLPEALGEQHLASAAATCNRLLGLLLDAGPLLTSARPTAFAPFLLAFIGLYAIVAGENYQRHGIASNRKCFLTAVSSLRAYLLAVKEAAAAAMMGAIDGRVAALRHYYADEPLYARMGPTSARPTYTVLYDTQLRRAVYVDYGFALPNADPGCFTEEKRAKRVIATVEGVDPLPSYLKIKESDLSGPVKLWYVQQICDTYERYFARGFAVLDGLAKLANFSRGSGGRSSRSGSRSRSANSV